MSEIKIIYNPKSLTKKDIQSLRNSVRRITKELIDLRFKGITTIDIDYVEVKEDGIQRRDANQLRLTQGQKAR